MITNRTLSHATLVLTSLAGLALSACADVAPPPAPRAAMESVSLSRSESALGQDVRQDLAALRQVTARYHRPEAAAADGWSAQITPCMTDPAGMGGMGFHYGNPSLIDGSVRADSPELLLYEPDEHGRLRLVAVEYIVPLSAWTSPQPPRLFDRDFRVNEAFQVWALHAWVWKENPSGMFADWNPTVSCPAA
jgi:hypothetical protein